MGKLTAKAFSKLPKSEQSERYKELSEHERWIWRTQYEPVKPILNAKGCMRTEKEQEQDEVDFEKILKEFGAMKEDETLAQWREKEKNAATRK